MKILVISNIYPPIQIGGYEQLCFDVVQGLISRGHSVRVLTSGAGVDPHLGEEGVDRTLLLDREFYSPASLFRPLWAMPVNRRALTRAVDTFDPDVIFVWNLENVGRPLMRQIAALGRSVLYHVSSPWIIQDDQVTHLLRSAPGAPVKNALKAFLRPFFRAVGMMSEPQEHAVTNASFSCAHLRNTVLSAGIAVHNPVVVHEGIAVGPLPQRDLNRTPPGDTLRLLYAGQLVPHKGVHTAIQAVARLAAEGEQVFLTVIGKGRPDYEEQLRELVTAAGIDGLVSFLPPVPREELSAVVVRHDVLVFPSIWEEPWSLMLLIGMACGIAVVGTPTGGSGELLVHRENALVFPAGDAAALAEQVRVLNEDRPLLVRLAENGASLVRSRYDIGNMVDAMEHLLVQIVEEH